MDAEFRCTLPSFHACRTKDDDIITQSLVEQVNKRSRGMWIVLFSVPRDGDQGLKKLFSARKGRKIRSCVRLFPSLRTES